MEHPGLFSVKGHIEVFDTNNLVPSVNIHYAEAHTSNANSACGSETIASGNLDNRVRVPGKSTRAPYNRKTVQVARASQHSGSIVSLCISKY